MMETGFYLSRIEVQGNDVEPAIIEFSPGLNIISGPSDTGKSYIFSLLNFMLGSDNPPEYIAESAGYSIAFLELKTYSGDTYLIKRKIIKSAPISLGKCSIGTQESCNKWEKLAPRHSATDEKNISRFLLGLSGIDLKWLKTNKENKTRSVSFRDIINYIMVGEERIITKESPILSGESSRKTVDKSLFQFLLTGNDSGELVEIVNPKLRAASLQGKIEVLREMASEIVDTIKNEKESSGELEERILILDAHINELADEVSDKSSQMKDLMNRKQVAWHQEQKALSRIISLDEFKIRFDLLEQQYQSDLQRLSFVIEGQHYLSQLNNVDCPVCGVTYDTHELTCYLGAEDNDKIIDGCYRESEKINIHLLDLKSTLVAMKEEIIQLRGEACIAGQVIVDCDNQIRADLQPVSALAKEELQNYIDDRQRLSHIKKEKDRLDEIYKHIHRLEIDLKKKVTTEDTQQKMEYETIVALCKEISSTLEFWNYGKNVVVSYDSKKNDLDIGGKSRASHGKGYRAIVYSAFAVGVMRYMRGNNLPHPGLVILDSPLTTYRERDEEGEEVSGNMQQAFFEYLAKSESTEQIIIFENKEPPITVREKTKYIQFSGVIGRKRQGFFPQK